MRTLRSLIATFPQFPFRRATAPVIEVSQWIAVFRVKTTQTRQIYMRTLSFELMTL